MEYERKRARYSELAQQIADLNHMLDSGELPRDEIRGKTTTLHNLQDEYMKLADELYDLPQEDEHYDDDF
jgi:hypothetical protein